MFICYCTQINATAISSHRWLVTTGTAICFLQSSACAISRANSSDAAAVSYNNTRATAAADALSDSLRKNIGSCSAASVGVFISIPRNDPIVWQHINDVPDNMFRQAWEAKIFYILQHNLYSGLKGRWESRVNAIAWLPKQKLDAITYFTDKLPAIAPRPTPTPIAMRAKWLGWGVRDCGRYA